MFTTKLLTASELERGAQFGDYTLLESIGRGGEGVVWSAYDNRWQRIVALKIITASNNDEMLNTLVQENFDQQVHLVASLNHPHILPIYEFGRLGTNLFFAMRYNCAGSLTNKLYGGPLPLEDVVEYAGQITSALTYLHSRTIIHRDLKPGNILLDGKGRTYLTDFGLAKQASDISMALHTGCGTGPYASYEQHTHSGMVAQSDIFSFGIVLFEMLTGSLPWGGEQYLGLKQFQENIELPDVRLYNSTLPASLNEPLRRMTALYWQDRPYSAADAYQSFVGALANDLPGEYSRLPLAVESHGEDVLLKENAQYLLKLVPGNWDRNLALFPLRFTHFALIDAASKQKGIHQLQLAPETRPFMLRGAFVYDYNLPHWWQENPDVETRIQVCEQVMANEEETAVARALSYLSDELAKTTAAIQLSPDSIDRLLDLAITQNNPVLRQNIFQMLERSIATTNKWQSVAFSTEADTKLAGFGLGDINKSQQVAKLIGRVRSETAVKAILDAPESETRQKMLQEIYQEAGSWPKVVPFSIRLAGYVAALKTNVLEDRSTVSLSRTTIGLLTGIFVSLLMFLGVFATPNTQMRDVYFANYPVSNLITIVEVNDDSLAREGRWSAWPRSRHAELISQLNEYGARVITFDFVFDTETEDDPILAQTMAEAGNVVQPVLGQGDAYRLEEGVMTFNDSILPNQALSTPAAMLGHTNILHDEDGYVRQLPLTIEVDGEQYPSIALASLIVFLNSQDNPYPQAENGTLAILGRQIPVGRFSEFVINFAGEPAIEEQRTFTTVSYHDVLDGFVPPDLLHGKIVLVGITATSEPDSYLTPVSNGRPMYGVEILANVMETIWSNRFVSYPSVWVQIGVLLLLSLVTSVLCTRPWRGLLFTVAIIVLYFGFAIFVFERIGLMLDLMFPLVAILLTYALVTAYRYSVEVRRRRQLVTMFQSNINPDMAKETIAAVERGDISLEGEFQDISVLAVDIRGVGADGLLRAPDLIMQQLNELKNEISELILKANGTIIQNDNDRITAVFNAPLLQADHPIRAVRTALTIQTQMFANGANPSQENMHLGYGVFSGKAIVGYAQNDNQASYTAFGETVQIAGQIAKQCQGNQLLVGEPTLLSFNAENQLAHEQVASINVRERVLPLDVYEVKFSI